MDKSNVLLSQSEIDALLDFLTEKKVSSTTLDQASIDKLIECLQMDGSNFRLQDYTSSNASEESSAIILPGNENINLPGSFVLTMNIREDSFIELVATSRISGSTYVIHPDSIDQVKYLENDASEWGYAVAPCMFDLVASLLKATFTQNTYSKVCKLFAKTRYGSEDATISPVYLPSNTMLERIID